MSKVVESIPATAKAVKSSTPFFNKGSGSLLSSTAETETPFFSRKESVPAIQAKLNIGQPNDKYEQEADAMADKVVQRLSENDNSFSPSFGGGRGEAVQAKPLSSNITPFVQTKCTSCGEGEKLQKKEEEDLVQESPLELQRKPIFESNAESRDDEKNIQRKCKECEKEEKVQKKSDSSDLSAASPTIESSLNTSRGSGSPIPDSTRDQMENSFGTDFSNVRIHTDSSAAHMSKELSAQAFTHGSDIYFNNGKYNPQSKDGQHLLAHELTHTVQQGASAIGIQKQDAPAEHLTSLNEMLDRFDVPENQVIDLLRQLTPTEKATVNSDVTYRIKMAAAFNTGEMVRAVVILNPSLIQKLEWVEAAAGSAQSINYPEISSLITSSSQTEKDTLKTTRWRDFFVDVCDNSTIVAAVTDLHFDLKTQLEWIETEADPSNIDYSQIQLLITLATQADRDVLKTNRWRDFFVGVCTNSTIITAVTDLHFDLKTQFEWIETEADPSNIDYSQIQLLITSATQADRDVLKTNKWRDFFVGVCTNKTMITAVTDLHFDLKTQLEWIEAEADPSNIDYSQIQSLIILATQADRDLLKNNKWRSFFVGVCDNDTMVDAVIDLNFDIKTKMEWMIEEGTYYSGFKKLLLVTSAADKAIILGDVAFLGVLKDYFSTWNNFAKTVELLGRIIPNSGSLMANASVLATLSSAWTASSAALTCGGGPTTAHEEGGWIYLNIITNSITTGRASVGAQASIDLWDPPEVDDSVIVGTFHTHPNVGPCWGSPFASPPDVRNANNRGVPNIVRGAFPAIINVSDVFGGPSQRLHLAGSNLFPGTSGGEEPQTPLNEENDLE